MRNLAHQIDDLRRMDHNPVMDDLDHRLIALLRADSRAPTAALAKALKVSRGTVQNRIDRLRGSGILLGFTIRLAAEDDPARVRAMMTIQIEGGRMAAIQRALSGVPAVTATHTTNGRWDLVAELEAADLPAFSAALDSIRAIPGIAGTETSLLLKTARF
jgi:DNA-binding Lrp family transcriptional regulator